jgi:hypothetical protein
MFVVIFIRTEDEDTGIRMRRWRRRKRTWRRRDLLLMRGHVNSEPLLRGPPPRERLHLECHNL